MAKKRFPLEKRFNVAMSERAYAKLRALNDTYRYSNNYLLTVVLENFDAIVDETRLSEVFERFADEYGAPEAGGMKKK